MSDPREWYILQYNGDCFIYDSKDEFPPDGDESLLIHVREIISSDEFGDELLDAAKDCLQLLEDWFPSMDDMRCADENDSQKIDRLKAAIGMYDENDFCDHFDYPSRLCDKCKMPVGRDWEFAFCQKCGEECIHGNLHHECNQCAIESDLAFDASREDLFFGKGK